MTKINQEKSLKTKQILEKYLANKFVSQIRANKKRLILRGRLFLYFSAVALTMQLGMYLWYYLEYDINIFNPKASEYLKDRFR